jgi:hypothetical protein
MKMVSVESLWQCETCFHHLSGKCNTWCDSGESYRPAYSKLNIIEAVPVEDSVQHKKDEFLKKFGQRMMNTTYGRLVENNVNIMQWISVEDDLPLFVHYDEVGSSWTDMVLAWNGEEVCCGEFNHYIEYDQIEFVGMAVGEIDGYGQSMKVTHWMRLPKAPKGK